MKPQILKYYLLILTTLCCVNLNGQNRIKKEYTVEESIYPVQLQKSNSQTLFSSAISGYYFEGFESLFPPAGWQIVDVLDTTTGWVSSQIADYPDSYEGLQSAHCQYAFPGPSGDDWLISPKFTVIAGDSFCFQFKFEYHGYPPDSTFILISTTDSALSSFSTVLEIIADTVTTPGLVLPLWTYKAFSLDAFTGQDIYVAFRNTNNNGDGIFIDNVEIGTRPAAEVGVKTIDIDDYYLTGISNPLATVKNYGGATQTFNVTMTITGGYFSTKSVTVASQSTSQISFDPWNAVIGTAVINVETSLAGDANPSNDTLTASTKVLEEFINYGWSVRDPLITGNAGGAVTSVCNGSNSRYFLMGGYSGTLTADAFEYDLSFATWAGINPLTVATSYPASAHANGKLFVFGGEGASNIIGTTQIYDYNLYTWSTGTPMPIAVSTAAFGTYKDSLVYVIGGNIGGGVGSNVVQIYNAYTDSWSTGNPKPGAPVFGCRGGIVNNKIVVAGGLDSDLGIRIGTTYVGEIDSINPTQISWIQVDDHPAGIISKAGTAVSLDTNSGLVVFSGGTITNTAAVTDRTFAYDVNSNSWKLGPNKPTAMELFYMTPVFENDSIYLVALGGGDGIDVTDKNEWLNLGFYQFPTGIYENVFTTEASLYPNPAKDATHLSLKLNSDSHLNIIITDIIGNSVLKICDKKYDNGNHDILVPTYHLSSGMYFCIINIDGYVITKKLLKN